MKKKTMKDLGIKLRSLDAQSKHKIENIADKRYRIFSAFGII